MKSIDLDGRPRGGGAALRVVYEGLHLGEEVFSGTVDSSSGVDEIRIVDEGEADEVNKAEGEGQEDGESALGGAHHSNKRSTNGGPTGGAGSERRSVVAMEPVRRWN
jgi:hypothetical protein